eukprot:m.149055 g.149055  ORF g.149055 m.149055 type:complete len:69 (+) comp14223_c0_seq2:670-876(+)
MIESITYENTVKLFAKDFSKRYCVMIVLYLPDASAHHCPIVHASQCLTPIHHDPNTNTQLAGLSMPLP